MQMIAAWFSWLYADGKASQLAEFFVRNMRTPLWGFGDGVWLPHISL